MVSRRCSAGAVKPGAKRVRLDAEQRHLAVVRQGARRLELVARPTHKERPLRRGGGGVPAVRVLQHEDRPAQRVPGRDGRGRRQRGGPHHTQEAADLHSTGRRGQGDSGLAQLQERLRLLERETREFEQGGLNGHPTS